MSKKSRKRNKKILGALAAGLGAMALMRGRGTAQGVSGADKAKFTSDKAYTVPVATKAVVADTAPAKVSNWISPRMHGGSTDDGVSAQKTRADYARNAKINARNTAIGSPLIDNPYKTPIAPGSGRVNWRAKGGSAYKSGGRVKGCGIAKRGLGRAMKKGRK
mgnify:CR=1 FL=1